MHILYLEPFCGGSHAAFTKTLTQSLDATWTTLTLPARHWKWRMRGSAPYFALQHRDALERSYDLVFASSYLPLAELFGLVPSLALCPSVLYFHENQIAYPVQAEHTGPRDMHFAFTQLVSALAATRCVFNSSHNLTSFLDLSEAYLKRLPDAHPPGWIDALRARSSTLPLPLELPDPSVKPLWDMSQDRDLGPVILWNHRWEYDKDPECFFETLFRLQEKNVPFRLVVCGQRFRKAPKIFKQAHERLKGRVLHWGYAEDRSMYHRVLCSSHIAVSTAIHEFFGISMVEAVHCGAYPLAPDRLSYPEILPDAYLYSDVDTLEARLERLCVGWSRGEVRLREDRTSMTGRFDQGRVIPHYAALFRDVVEESLRCAT